MVVTEIADVELVIPQRREPLLFASGCLGLGPAVLPVSEVAAEGAAAHRKVPVGCGLADAKADIVEDVAVVLEVCDRVSDGFVEYQIRIGLFAGATGAVLPVISYLTHDIDRRKLLAGGFDLSNEWLV
jgi:hypothetical protein